VPAFGENMYQVPQFGAALGCREFANDVHDNDSVELACGDFKTHGAFSEILFSPCAIIELGRCFR